MYTYITHLAYTDLYFFFYRVKVLNIAKMLSMIKTSFHDAYLLVEKWCMCIFQGRIWSFTVHGSQNCKNLSFLIAYKRYEPLHDKPNKMTCAPSEDSDQPGHPSSLIRVVTVRSVGSLGPNTSSCGQWRLWSDWADAQADLSLPWAHRSFCWFCHAAAQLLLHNQ